MLFQKIVDCLLVILTNNKQKIDYFQKYQALDDKKQLTGAIFHNRQRQSEPNKPTIH